MTAPRTIAPGLFARLGLAVAHPRRASALASHAGYAGRAGTDLIAAIAVLLVATKLRLIASALWLAAEGLPGFGIRLAVRGFGDALWQPLGALLVGGFAVFALA